MDTASLKSFAASARIELIREVGARITAVLAQGSPDRVEQPRAVTALERTIAAGGGEDKGKAHVANKVAYTWFNRIIALRFMDANGYTGIGVVSPAADQAGQPEVLAAAKRGQIDGDVVKGANAATVAGLLNGTRQPRPGVDAQAEAYALLLADYCRYWNRAMPFMFEREGDYTELLIPANLLAEDSVLNRSVKVLTEEVCRDVEVIGWLYQFYISERKDEVFAGFKKNKKAGADEIPAATQLFTPHWIVRYLVENSLGRLWMLNNPQSRLVDQMDYYIAPVDEETDFLRISGPEELTVIDPACGSGHMLTYAFDLLYAIYEEEGYAPSQIPSLILARNLYGTEIDPRAGALAAFALTMKAAARRKLFLKNPVEPNICVLEPISFSADELSYLMTEDSDRHAEEAFWNQFREADLLGALIRPRADLTARLMDHVGTLDSDGDLLFYDVIARARRAVTQAAYLATPYSALVANPPYMGSGNMDARVAAFAQRSYPRSKADLFAMFIERSFDFIQHLGYSAMVTMESWMFLRTYADLRSEVLAKRSIKDMVHMPYVGKGSTSMGINFGTAATVVKNEYDPDSRATFQSIRYFETDLQGVPTSFPVLNERRSVLVPSELRSIPGSPIAFWLSDTTRKAFVGATYVGTVATLREGINTGNNDLFLRRWWEVAADRISFSRTGNNERSERWVPHKKGGPFRKWAGNEEYILDWGAEGASIHRYHGVQLSTNGAPMRGKAYFFRPSLSWSRISTSDFSLRSHGAGFAYDSTAPSIFSEERSRSLLLGLLNSVVVRHLLSALSPTLDFRIAALSNIPLPAGWRNIDLSTVKELESLARSDWNTEELSWDFEILPWVPYRRATDLRTADFWHTRADGFEALSARARDLEEQNNRTFIEAYGLDQELDATVPLERVSLKVNANWRFPTIEDEARRRSLANAEAAKDLVSYAVGCMVGRYSLDRSGLILASQGATFQDYLAEVASPTFMPDADNVIPIVDGDWFEDDIVERFRQFLRAAFGEQHFEENLKFVTMSLGVKNLRDYFVKSFYKDHVQRYKKRPIYWLFSSPKGSFNALIYMHRYTPSTVSTVLTYLREYVTKMESALQQAERVGNAKEADRLRKILVELNEYEHDTLFPKASENVVIDLDDGVKANYPKFGAALKKIPGLEAASD